MTSAPGPWAPSAWLPIGLRPVSARLPSTPPAPSRRFQAPSAVTTPASTPSLPPSPPLVLGVAGGIAAGKSSVARLLAGPGGIVLDADRWAREELDSSEGRSRLEGRYGPEALEPGGSVDREFLAGRVFADSAERAWLEGWIHPAVRVRMTRALEAARTERAPRVVLDVPLLFENEELHELVEACDALVFVDAPPEVRDARARESRGWPTGEVARRERAQLPTAEKRARADYVIDNTGDQTDLERAVQGVLEDLTRR